jgi:hypothetical protein
MGFLREGEGTEVAFPIANWQSPIGNLLGWFFVSVRVISWFVFANS